MKSYNTNNLQQSVRNLFAQARYEFRAIHDIESKFNPSAEGLLRCKVYSLWDNKDDCFYATAFELIRINNTSNILIDLSVYVKYSEYTCSCPMGSCEKAEDVFLWLKDKEALQKCLDSIDRIISDID